MLVVHTRVVLTDRSGDKWLEYILETELIGLAGGLGLEVKEREEPRKAPCFLEEPWVDAACHLLSEEAGEEQVGAAQDFPKFSSSSVPMEMSVSRVLSSVSPQASGSNNPNSFPMGVPMWKTLPENEVYRETENNLMIVFELLDSAQAYRPPHLKPSLPSQRLLPLFPYCLHLFKLGFCHLPPKEA